MKFTNINITDLVGAKIPVENELADRGYVTIDQITDGIATDQQIGLISSLWSSFAGVNAVTGAGNIFFSSDSSYSSGVWGYLPPGTQYFSVGSDYAFTITGLPLPVDSQLTIYNIQTDDYANINSSTIDNLLITFDTFGAVSGLIDLSVLEIQRTPASDDAVASLISKGWSISIYGGSTPLLDGFSMIPNNGTDVSVLDPRIGDNVIFRMVDAAYVPTPGGPYFFVDAISAYGTIGLLVDIDYNNINITTLETNFTYPTINSVVINDENMLPPFSMTFYNGQAWIRPNA